MLPKVFDAFLKASPVSVMARGMAERLFSQERLDAWFDKTAECQYTRELLFSSVFNLMVGVVTGSHKSIHSAYQASPDRIGVSVVSVYKKLSGIEPHISAEMVRWAAAEATRLIEELNGALPPLMPGYRVKILDGNCLAASEHRIKELRGLQAGPLPGKSLVVLDPALRIPIDVFPCEDGHTQERALLPDVLCVVKARDLWIGDRNFCTRAFLSGIAERDAYFVIREHANLPLTPDGLAREVGAVEAGLVYEDGATIALENGETLRVRRITVHLNKPTRDGDREVHVLCNLPPADASAECVTDLYGDRWLIETAFQDLATHLRSEITTLGYPPAALFGFCVGLVAYIVMAVIKAALQTVHGAQTMREQFSGYYLADELGAVYRGMAIAVPTEEWSYFSRLSLPQMAALFVWLAKQVDMRRFKKHPRRTPKKPPTPSRSSKSSHVSTARLLRERVQ